MNLLGIKDEMDKLESRIKDLEQSQTDERRLMLEVLERTQTFLEVLLSDISADNPKRLLAESQAAATKEALRSYRAMCQQFDEVGRQN